MAKLGTKEYPICFHTQTEEKIVEIISICQRNGWEFIAKAEPDEPEDIREVEYMLNPSAFEKMPRMKLARLRTFKRGLPNQQKRPLSLRQRIEI